MFYRLFKHKHLVFLNFEIVSKIIFRLMRLPLIVPVHSQSCAQLAVDTTPYLPSGHNINGYGYSNGLNVIELNCTASIWVMLSGATSVDSSISILSTSFRSTTVNYILTDSSIMTWFNVWSILQLLSLQQHLFLATMPGLGSSVLKDVRAAKLRHLHNSKSIVCSVSVVSMLL